MLKFTDMKTKKKKHLPDKSCLVKKQSGLLKIYRSREQRISNFFNDYEHYQDSVKLLLSVQQCAFTSPHFESLTDFEREELQLRFPKFMELIMDLGKEKCS